MNKKALFLTVLISIFPAVSYAADKSLADKVSAMVSQLQQERGLNKELKAKLAVKEKEVASLRKREKALEMEIEKLKNQLESLQKNKG